MLYSMYVCVNANVGAGGDGDICVRIRGWDQRRQEQQLPGCLGLYIAGGRSTDFSHQSIPTPIPTGRAGQGAGGGALRPALGGDDGADPQPQGALMVGVWSYGDVV